MHLQSCQEGIFIYRYIAVRRGVFTYRAVRRGKFTYRAVGRRIFRP